MTALAVAIGVAVCLPVSPAAAVVGGPPSFGTALNLTSTGADMGAVAVGDLNGDGKPDLATAIRSQGLAVFLNAGGGAFAPVATYPVPGGENNPFVVSMAIRDFNGDGNPDVVAASAGRNLVVLWLGTGGGAVAPGVPVELNPLPNCGNSSSNRCLAAFPVAVVTGDFNEDGKFDFATSNANTDNVSIVLGHGDGTFGAATQVALRPGADFPFGLAVGDVDKDGHLDLVAAGDFSNNVLVLHGDGHGGFVKSATLAPGVTAPQYLRLADLDEDGDLDIVTGNASGQFAILLGDGSGGFGSATVTALGAGGASTSSGDVVVGDLNGDGHPDLAFTGGLSSSVLVVVGDGHGGFPTPATSYDLGGADNPDQLAVGDLDGDGQLDVAVENYANSAADTKNVSVLLNTTTVRASSGVNLHAQVAGYVAIEGGDGNFGDLTPSFDDKAYVKISKVKIATSSPAGVRVYVQASNPANTTMGGLGEVTVLGQPFLESTFDGPQSWLSFATPLLLFRSVGPTNQTALQAIYKVVVPGGKVLRKGDVYGEDVTYTAISTMP